MGRLGAQNIIKTRLIKQTLSLETLVFTVMLESAVSGAYGKFTTQTSLGPECWRKERNRQTYPPTPTLHEVLGCSDGPLGLLWADE
jgi:hypothetical protein